MSKKILDFETSSEVGHSLNLLKALGDAIVNIGCAGDQANLLEDTLENLGLLIVERVDAVKGALELL
jgi:hypothetical protein